MYVQKHIHWRVIWNYSWKDLLIFIAYDLTLAILHGPLKMTCEIDLRQMLGETNLPAPMQPHDGVLY